MFEIGNSLREARLRQGLEIPRIEGDTKIRGKYLRALEDEGFDTLPGDTYVKGFLRTYADYLGLDGQLYVDEFNSRFSTADEPVAAPSKARRRMPRRSESNLVVVALAGIVAVTVLVVVGLAGIGSDAPTPETPLLDTSIPTTTAEEDDAAAGDEGPAAADPEAAAGNERPRARLVLTAARGSCWLQVRAGGVGGRLLYEGTLEEGQTQRFVKDRRLWLELGAPGNLNVKLNGRAVENFPTRSAVVAVTASGVRTLSTG
ncbi:MAG TPA: RodZ domain-containing protein [Gaiellaceae bacterium]|nr:RodZ domain-containing protein [Gaiellaceae bacterium]